MAVVSFIITAIFVWGIVRFMSILHGGPMPGAKKVKRDLEETVTTGKQNGKPTLTETEQIKTEGTKTVNQSGYHAKIRRTHTVTGVPLTKKGDTMTAERLCDGDVVPMGKHCVICSYCAAENLVDNGSPMPHSCYFCHQPLN